MGIGRIFSTGPTAVKFHFTNWKSRLREKRFSTKYLQRKYQISKSMGAKVPWTPLPMLMVSYHLYYDYTVILTALSVQLHIYAKCNKLYRNMCSSITLLKIKNESFSVLAWHGLYWYEVGALKYCILNFLSVHSMKHIYEMPSWVNNASTLTN